MGRHAADGTAPGSSGPDDRGKAAGPRLPRHADLFMPAPDSAAARVSAEQAAETFGRLVEPHRATLRVYVLKLTDGDEAAADSVLKETLYRLAQDPQRYPRRPSAVRPWLVLAARNVMRDGERYAPAGRDDRPYPLLQELRSPEPAAQVPASAIVGMMNDLPGADRELLVEVVYGGVSLEAAAVERGVPVETVKSRLYFAMRSLRGVLDQHLSG
jgi:RNA polymerase sigma-70 factor (ECF subfamily)